MSDDPNYTPGDVIGSTYEPTIFDIIAVALGGTCSRHMDACRVVEALAEHGYVIAPKEPTPEMDQAGRSALPIYENAEGDDFRIAYRAAIACVEHASA